MIRIKMYMPKVKLCFYPLCKVKYGLQNGVSTIPLIQFLLTMYHTQSKILTKFLRHIIIRLVKHGHPMRQLRFLLTLGSYVFSQHGATMLDQCNPLKPHSLSIPQAKNGLQPQLRFIQIYLTSVNRFFRMMVATLLNWWRLIISLAKSNKLPSMELSWAWEPTYRERAC